MLYILTPVFCVALCVGAVFSFSNNNKVTAHAATYGELYDASQGGFSESALNKFAQQAGSYNTIKDLIKAFNEGAAPIQASQFGTDTLTFDGMEFYPVYVSKAGDYVALTLLTKNYWQSTFSDGTNTNAVINPLCNLYSTTYLHACINAGQTSSGYYVGDFAGKAGNSTPSTSTTFTMHPVSEGSNGKDAPTTVTRFQNFARGGKFSEYIIAPKDTYQTTLSTYKNDIANTHADYINNSSTTYNYSYTSWADDNVWLPSREEVTPSTGTWAMTAAKNDVNQFVWTRSAYPSDYYTFSQIDRNGVANSNSWASSTYYYRAAIHLNLTKAAALAVPSAVEANYTGSKLDISAVSADQLGWYDGDIMELSYPEANSGDMKDAGTYSVKVTLKNGLVFKGTPDTSKGETESARYFDFEITPKKLAVPQDLETTYDNTSQSLGTLAASASWYDNDIFSDSSILSVSQTSFTDANESGYSVSAQILSSNYVWSDNASNSSDTRTFKVKVKKKKLTVSFETKNGLKVAKLADESEIYTNDNVAGKKPELTTKYSQSGTLSDPSTGSDAPTSTGNWYAYAVLTNADSCNYCVDAKEQFTFDKIGVAYPTLSSDNSFVYNGAPQEFTFTGFDSTKMNAPAVPSGADSFDGTTLKATNAGDYTPVFTLKDTSLYEWTGTAPAAVKITPKAVAVAFTGERKTEWQKGEAVSFTLSAAALTGDILQLSATYQKQGGTAFNLTVTDNGDGTHAVTIPANAPRGQYTLTVKVADSCKNYVAVREATHGFEITAQGLELEDNELDWVIGGKHYTTADLNTEGFLEIEYTGADLVPSVDDSTFVDYEIESYGGDSSAVNAGTYTRTVRIVANSEEYSFDKTFTLKYKITPKKLDFTNAEWEYSTDDGSTWNKLTASNKPAYNDGNPINVRLSPDYLSGLGLADGDYIINYNNTESATEQGAQTSSAYITLNNSNYTTASGNIASTQLSWEITARGLTYTWTGTQAVTVHTAGGENTFEFPAVKFEDGAEHTDSFEYYYKVGGTEYTLDALKEYIAANWSVTTPVSGTVGVRLKSGVTEVNINQSEYPFSTGAPKTALEVGISGSGAEYGKVDFALKVTKGTSDERARTVVAVTGGLLAQVRTFDGNSTDLTAFMNGLGVGKYVVAVSLKAGQETSYVLTKTLFEFEVLTRKVVVPQVTGDITFNGEYIDIAQYLDSNYNADIMSMVSGYTNKTAGDYTVTFKLASSNYMWVEPTSAEPASKKLFGKAVLFVDGIAIDNSALTATLDWRINKIVLGTDGWKFGKKEEGVSLNALADYQKMIADNQLDIAIAYRYYDTNGNLIEEPVLKGGDKYIVEAFLTGADAVNFEFEDGTDEAKSVSARQDYTVPQSAVAAFFGSVADFAKANWLWFVIGAAILLFLIILICIIASAKKKKKKREALEKEERERRLAEEKEEKEREREERKLEREERMARMNQQQAMPQMMMPQMMPQMQMPQPQYAPQPQPVQPVMGGGSSNEIAELKAEILAMKAEQAARESSMKAEVMKAEQAAKEMSEIKAGQQVAQTKSDLLFASLLARLNGDQNVNGGISYDKLSDFIRSEVKNAIADERVIAQSAQPAQLTDGTTANAATAQVPPDAVMTTVTTTKIDTTKKPAQNAQGNAQAARPIVRNYVAPMPVDDGRVFDVGGFYKPADPLTDYIDDGEEKK